MANSWLTGWNLRKVLEIAGTADGIQTNYQMMLTVYYGPGTDSPGIVYCGGNTNTDFSDIRFTEYEP
jgi:hypothetical protein